MINLTNEQLIPYIKKAQKEKDRASFVTLYQATFLNEYSFVYHYLNEDEYQTQDVLMEAYYLIFSELNSLRDLSSFRMWLNQIVFRLAYTKKTNQEVPHTYTKETLPTAIDRQLRFRYRIIAQKPQSDHTVILYYHCGLSTFDIEKLTGNTQTEVISNLKLGKERYNGILNVNEDIKKHMLNLFDTQVSLKEEILILKWIFVTCNFEPLNLTSKDYLIEEQSTQKQADETKKVSPITIFSTILVVLVVCFFLVEPKMTIKDHTTTPYNVEYVVDVQNFIPIKTIHASIDALNIPIEQLEHNHFLIKPNVNGIMKVTLTLSNSHSKTMLVNVNDCDRTPPKLIEKRRVNNRLQLVFEDDESGIDFSTMVVKDKDGNTITPISTDETKQIVVLPYHDESLEINVLDHSGNSLHLILNPLDKSKEVDPT